MYVRERSGISRGGEKGQKDVRPRERGEEASREEGGESDGDERTAGIRRAAAAARGSMRRRQQVAETPSGLLTRVVGSVFKFVRLAEFEILFALFFVITFLLCKDLTARPAFNQLLSQKRFEEEDRLY